MTPAPFLCIKMQVTTYLKDLCSLVRFARVDSTILLVHTPVLLDTKLLPPIVVSIESLMMLETSSTMKVLPSSSSSTSSSSPFVTSLILLKVLASKESGKLHCLPENENFTVSLQSSPDIFSILVISVLGKLLTLFSSSWKYFVFAAG